MALCSLMPLALPLQRLHLNTLLGSEGDGTKASLAVGCWEEG
jgi:hypothetical protein